MAALALARTSETVAVGDAGNTSAVAPARVSRLLAVEVSRPTRSAQDGPRDNRSQSADRQRKCAVGCATHPWRIAQARLRHCRVNCCQVHAEHSSARRQPVLAHIPRQPDGRHRRHRSPDRADRQLSRAIRSGRCKPKSQTHSAAHGNEPTNGRVAGTADQ